MPQEQLTLSYPLIWKLSSKTLFQEKDQTFNYRFLYKEQKLENDINLPRKGMVKQHM